MDLIFINGVVHTMDKNKTTAEAVAVVGDRIRSVGNTEEILKLRTEATKVVDLEGKTLVPGFNDSHMHLLNYGYSLTQVNLIGTKSLEEVLERTREFIKEKGISAGKWVRGRGWNQDYFSGDKVFPTRYDLDKISLEHPICVTRTCGHVSVVNSKALEVLGITKDTPQVDGGHFDLDENGEPVGIFREDALRLVYDAIPTPGLDEIKSMMLAAYRDLNAAGITSVGTDDFEALPQSDYENVIKAYRELIAEGKNSVRIYEQCLLPVKENLQGFLGKGYNTGWGDEAFKIGPLKLLQDGSLGARTAALMKDYEDEPGTTGIITATQEYLNDLVMTAHKADCQIAIHGIGDKGMYMAFEAMEKALAEYPKKDHRHGIVHAQITDEYLLDKFKELGAIAYIQPIFLDYDWKMVKARVGAERERTSYNWKSLLDRGVHIPCGSDAPVETFSVMYGIYEAVTRKDLEGNPDGGWLPEQALTPYEALYAYTMEGAYASFEEDLKGSIEPDKLADMVVLSSDILSIDPNEIKDVKVESTIFGGRVL